MERKKKERLYSSLYLFIYLKRQREREDSNSTTVKYELINRTT